MREILQQLLGNLPSILVFGAVLARIWDRHKQRQAIQAAEKNPELRKQLTDSLPPINVLIVIAVGVGLIAQIIAWRVQDTLAQRPQQDVQPAKCIDCRDDCSCKNGQCKRGARPVPTSSLARAIPRYAGPIPSISLDL